MRARRRKTGSLLLRAGIVRLALSSGAELCEGDCRTGTAQDPTPQRASADADLVLVNAATNAKHVAEAGTRSRGTPVPAGPSSTLEWKTLTTGAHL